MARVYQVPAHAFRWLALGVVLAVLPHLVSAPLWLQAAAVVLVVWRLLIQRGRLRMPGILLRTAMLFALSGATLWSYGTVLGPAAGVALLVAAFCLKLLEMFRLRDAYVVVVLSYFVLATVFLLYRNALVTIYVLVVLCIITAALIGINHPEAGVRSRTHLRVAGGLMLQATPLMLVLFVLVPRIEPLWNLPSDKREARTGMSDSMSPGEISRLAQSDELAFRVEFDGEPPPMRERYWRGLTYSWFNGRRWSQATPQNINSRELVYRPGDRPPDWYERLRNDRQGEQYRYRVLLEPTQQPWMYALTVPFVDDRRHMVARDFRLLATSEIRDLYTYRVTSWTEMTLDQPLPAWERRLNLSLPSEGNPQARAMAERWREEAGTDTNFANRMLMHFRNQPFYYTLEPPLLGDQRVDDFLFNTRRGFCEHYAQTMAFMLRAAGIPARIVAGYQGGEVNTLGSHLLIRQSDAHVWVEAWLDQRGWVQMDPTAAVAPERIEMGLREALEQQGETDAFGALDGFTNSALMQQLGLFTDYYEFLWQKWVVGYEQEQQGQLLSGLFGEITPVRLAIIMGVAAGSVLMLMFLLMLWGNRKPPLHWWQQEYWSMRKLLVRAGVDDNIQHGPRGMLAGVRAQSPAAAGAFEQWCQMYETLVYARPDLLAEGGGRRKRMRQLRRQVARSLRR
jgi:transglutaminase-like putative cysteine protease